MVYDVVVLGSGPAGLLIAHRLASRGLSVACVSAQQRPRWVNNYGVWSDELPGDLRGFAEARWADPIVSLGEGRRIGLGREYMRVDNVALVDWLVSEATAAGIAWICDVVSEVEHREDRSVVCGERGARCEARLVIDATGARPALAQRPGSDRIGYQVAFGVIVRGFDASKLDAPMTLMDYSPVGPEASPTFLYAMALDDDRVFLEETTLVSRPALSFETLRYRLDLRLRRQYGVELDALEVVETERCFIPMGAPLPERPQRVLAYGAAASMVQPVSGYQFARAASWAAPLADEIVAALSDESDPSQVSARAWQALWSPARVQQRELYLYGMEMLLGMSGERLRAFFETFFAQPQPRWAGFLGGELGSAELARVMWSIFRASSNQTRQELMRPAASARGLSQLARGLWPLNGASR